MSNTDLSNFFPELDPAEPVASGAAQSAVAAAPPPANAPPPNAKKRVAGVPRPGTKARSELNTRNAIAAPAPKSNPRLRDYDPIAGEVAPLMPEETMTQSTFRYDSEHPTRTYNTLTLHGRLDYEFDADNHPATAAYRQRLESEDLNAGDPGYDEVHERELELRAKLKQPAEAIDALRADLKNPEFVSRLVGGTTLPTRPPTQVLYEHAREDATQLLTTNALGLLSRKSADFFTANSSYNLTERARLHDEAQVRATQESNAKAILVQLNEELQAIPEHNTDRRDALVRELHELQLSVEQLSATVTASAVPPAPPSAAAVLKDTEIAPSDARELFRTNALELLPAEMRGAFMSIPEIAAVWRLLHPIMVQPDRRRLHYNGVEFVRAMALCGAKFDGCIRMIYRGRLGTLLDDSGASPAGDVGGAHGHYDYNANATTIVVFKFYVVRRNKQNVELLKQTGAEDQSKGKAQKKAADPSKVNSGGLLDLENHLVEAENDGTEETGTLHSIRYLSREFMFCIRVVALEPPPCDYGRESEDYPSENDESSVNSRNISFFEKSACDDDDESSDMNCDDSMTTEQPVDADFFVHSDDEEDDRRDLSRYKRSTHESIPEPDLKISKKTAELCVGTHKADTFSFLINSHAINQLCLRSFLFYSDKNVVPK